MPYETIAIEKRNKGIAWLTIDNPPANAINETLMQDLEAAADELTADKSVRVVVIASNHKKTFVAGLDLKNAMSPSTDHGDDDNMIAKESARMQACFQKFAEMPKPVIAAINGYALGGGCELALACDFRIMGKGKIGLTEVSLGLIPGAGGTQRMTKLLGRAKAVELIFGAKRLKAEEAEAVGLIHRQVDPENMEANTTAFAEELAEGAVHAMGLAKRAINAAEGSLAEGLEIEANAFSETFETDEPGIGLAAFFQKEKPKFLNDS
ncbi:enoyl-CoA hydratase/isomerase family protein [Lentibacillus sp. CBA3610]|uniref:enoyl-CoA hydratase/isomerase family protein n=1 Tax=Lentibacillus sp. CBA3610 TaxID=2518176 RepID=UPI00159611CB|nr:enoyl-CoA hydratase/isomerase family protein [Lentibacillus sp. CBA3610]QKY68750.1 enoyl-CoA hydratase/isomerase family protein [Lentibacillus sp. CBA3610]